MSCRHFVEFMRVQQETLRQALAENKWYLSERAGQDVGEERALVDFCDTHLDRIAHEFRVQFCRHHCHGRGECELVQRVDALPSSSQTHERVRSRRGEAARLHRGSG